MLESHTIRKELNQRMDEALSVLQDPWKEIIHTESKRRVYESLPLVAE